MPRNSPGVPKLKSLELSSHVPRDSSSDTGDSGPLSLVPGGKKLIYNHVRMPLVALDDLHGTAGDFYQGLAEIVTRNNGIWSPEAENYVLANAPRIW
jgi:hypothetical protein